MGNGILIKAEARRDDAYRAAKAEHAAWCKRNAENKGVTLTKENASEAAVIINKYHPEWGTKRFNHNDQPLNDGMVTSSCGSGCNGRLLHESDFDHWEITSWK